MSTILKDSRHGESLALTLAGNLKNSGLADVKIICSDGSAWAHRLVLAAVSPVLKHILLSVEASEDVATIYLPQLSKIHLSLVLDYVYRGRMYIKSNQLQHVLAVIEVLNLECGVSVSKKVKEEDEAWVEEATFTSFHDKRIGEVCKSLKKEFYHYEDDSHFIEDEEPIEVKPQMQSRSLRSSIAHQDDEDDDYAVVEVACDESDEDEDHSNDDPQHFKCVMCSKEFKHLENLRIHTQSHLGSSLRSCQRCKKNFRNGLEYDLHMNSHAYVSHLKKVNADFNLNSDKSVNRRKAQHLKRTSIKRLLPKRTDSAVSKPPAEKPLEATPEPAVIPSKIPKEPKLQQRQQKKPSAKTSKKSDKKAKNPILNGDSKPKAKSAKKNVAPLQNSKAQNPWNSCKLTLKIPLVRLEDQEKMDKKNKKRKRSESPKKAAAKKLKITLNSPSPSVMTSSPVTLKKPTIEDTLTCPTCDKVFMAKSILERHLKKSKHGVFEADKDVMAPPPVISQALDKAMAEGRQLPHLNAVLQPKIEVGGREVNKYECHLCKQVFLRVKDLAKHRERMMCSAWLSK